MSTVGEISANDFLKPHGKEAIKQYFVYDVLNRISEVYECIVETAVGEPCLVTYYTYDGGSSRVKKMKEAMSTWQAGWDV